MRGPPFPYKTGPPCGAARSYFGIYGAAFSALSARCSRLRRACSRSRFRYFTGVTPNSRLKALEKTWGSW